MTNENNEELEAVENELKKSFVVTGDDTNEEEIFDSESDNVEDENNDLGDTDDISSNETIDDIEPMKFDSKDKIEIKKEFNQRKNDKKHSKDYDFFSDVLKIGLLILSGFVLVLSIWIMFRSFSPASSRTNPILTYNVQNGAKYKIYLKKNDFYESPYLGMGELVPAPFIDYVEIDFSSAVQAPKSLNYNYSYKVTGDLSATYTGGEEDKKGTIWSKKYNLAKSDNKIDSGTSIAMNQKVKIKYDTYNAYVNRYKLKASVPMDAFLTVTFTASVTSDVEGSDSKLNENITQSVKIPLSVATVQVTKQDGNGGSKMISNVEKIAASKNYVLLLFSGVLMVCSGFVTIKLLIDLKKMTENHSVLFKLNKILKDHDQVIVEVDSVPKIKRATKIEIKKFKDMIDIQQELHLPILYYKAEDIADSAFFIIHGNHIYKYMINSEAEQI